MSRLTNASTKLLWMIGALAAFGLIGIGLLVSSLQATFGGDDILPAVGVILGGIIAMVLGATFRRVFRDNWPPSSSH